MAFVLTGCGGPSEEDFRADSNDACGDVVGRIYGIGRLWEVPERTRADRALQLAGRVQELRGNLADVDRPEEMDEDAESYRDYLAEQQRALEELGERTAPPEQVEANLRAIANDAGQAARSLGLDECALVDDALRTVADEAPVTG